MKLEIDKFAVIWYVINNNGKFSKQINMLFS